MSARHRFWPAAATALLLLALLPELGAGLGANLRRLHALRGMDLVPGAPTSDEAAWQAGWHSLCRLEGPVAGPRSEVEDDALWFVALARLDAGNYAGALPLFERLAGLPGQPRAGAAAAYAAALGLDWQRAARLAPALDTPRHRRWWGTIAYLAAQELALGGRQAEAEALYRRADAAYDIQGPYLGLALVDCLEAAGRPVEAWDAYRRALVVLPVEEALAHEAAFDRLRLAGLQARHALVPGDPLVGHWLAFYQAEAGGRESQDEALAAAPQPRVSLALDLGGGRHLLGYDFRREDLETGPFLRVDFYVQDGEGGAAGYRRLRRTVLNQAPNAAFAWDLVPGGVRPAGWNRLLYDRNLAALYKEDLPAGGTWLCLDGPRISAVFGLQSSTAALQAAAGVYLQGGEAFLARGDNLTVGRTWFGLPEPNNYSYFGGSRPLGQVETLAGSWEPLAGAHSFAIWILVDGDSKGCLRDLYLFALPEFDSVSGGIVVTNIHTAGSHGPEPKTERVVPNVG